MGGMTRLPVKDKDIIVFSNADSAYGRMRMTLWVSYDGAETWTSRRLVHGGAAGYSSLTCGRPGTTSEGWIFLHFEGGSNAKSSEGGSYVVRCNLSWILNGGTTGDGKVPDWMKPFSPDPKDDPGKVFMGWF